MLRRAYYASKLSENISETPEGFLICKNVPISRIGHHTYYGLELGDEFNPEETYKVYRTEEEVFSKISIASFEGKGVTDDHPPDGVSADNAKIYICGTASNIRRGEDENSDKLLADLIIYDKILIDEIKAGKREISCGYDCVTEEENGKLYQRAIRGNHIAVVDNGRAGNAVKINDENKTETSEKSESKKRISFERTDNFMAKKQKGFWEKLFGTMKDADPGELAEVVEEIIAKDEDHTADEEPAITDNTPPPSAGSDNPVLAAIQALADQVTSLSDEVATMKADNENKTDMDPLEKLEQELAEELADEETGESEHSVDPDLIDEETTDEGETTDEDTTEDEEEMEDSDFSVDEDLASGEETVSKADKARVLKEIRTMKPIIAKMNNKKDKKIMIDHLTRLSKKVSGKKSSQKDGYRKLSGVKHDSLKKRQGLLQNDSKKIEQTQAAYDKFNPHIKK